MKTKIAKKSRNSRKKAQKAQKGWDEKTSALGQATGIAAKTRRAIGLAEAEERKECKKKSEVRIL